MISKPKIRKDDTVEVIAGKDKGKRGTVVRIIPKKDAVIVSGVNIVKKAITCTVSSLRILNFLSILITP